MVQCVSLVESNITRVSARGLEGDRRSSSPWNRAGSSSGRGRGENLYLLLSIRLTSSLEHTSRLSKHTPNTHDSSTAGVILTFGLVHDW